MNQIDTTQTPNWVNIDPRDWQNDVNRLDLIIKYLFSKNLPVS